jgi:prepilin-type N-terminal cleavage/methylation domain-containing protein
MKSFRKLYRTKNDGEQEEGGFTLIELLIVVLILGILAAIVAFAVGAFTSSSAVAACNTDAKTVESAVAAYQATNTGQIPTSGLLTSTGNGGPYIHNWPGNSAYYVISLSGANVNIQLTSTDAAHQAPYTYPTTAAPFLAGGVNYDTWTWSSAHAGGSKSYAGTANVCAGA